MLEIRKYRSEDFEEVVLLLAQLWPNKEVNRAELLAVMNKAPTSGANIYLCAVAEDHVVGFGSFTERKTLWPDGTTGYIDELVVDSHHRGTGIGKELLNALVTMAEQRGCCRIELDAALYRKDAHRFYEHNGFVHRGNLFSKNLNVPN